MEPDGGIRTESCSRVLALPWQSKRRQVMSIVENLLRETEGAP